MKLSLVSIEKDGIVRVAIDGNITMADFTAGERNPLETLLGANWATNKVLLNLEKCNYIDSSAIGWLIQCNKLFKEAGGSFVCYALQPSVRQILDVLKIGRVVPLVADEAEARTLAGGSAQ